MTSIGGFAAIGALALVDQGEVVLLALIGGILIGGGLAGAAWIAPKPRKRRAMLDSSRLEQILEGAGYGLWEWMPTSPTLVRSPSTWRSLGYEGNGYRPTWESLIHADDRSTVESAFASVAGGEVTKLEIEYRVKAKDMSWHWVVERGGPVERNGGGQPLRLLGTTCDVTEHRRQQAADRELDTLALMGRLAAHLAHEINNPLAGIRNSFLLIKDSIPPTHRFYPYVGAIDREINRISTITRQLYETYKPAADEDPDVPASTVVADAVALLRWMNPNVAIQLDLEPSSECPLPIPNALLRQIVFNLVQNAVEASPPDLPVTVGAWSTADKFILSVRDRGAGIPAELRERLFDATAEQRKAMHASGMGLGLWLVRRSADAMGAELQVVDPETGGTDFRVEVPVTA